MDRRVQSSFLNFAVAFPTEFRSLKRTFNGSDYVSRYNPVTGPAATSTLFYTPLRAAVITSSMYSGAHGTVGGLAVVQGEDGTLYNAVEFNTYWNEDKTDTITLIAKEDMSEIRGCVTDGYRCVGARLSNPHVVAAVAMVLLPKLAKDTEFLESFTNVVENLVSGETTDAIPVSVMCDNFYRRFTNKACEAHLEIPYFEDSTVETTLNLGELSVEDLAKFTVVRTRYGQMSSYWGGTVKDKVAPRDRIDRALGDAAPSATVRPKAKRKSSKVDNRQKEFVGKFPFAKDDELEEWQKKAIPVLPSHLVIPDWLFDIANDAYLLHDTLTPMSTFCFYGPAGTGKTTAVRILAAGLNLPHYVVTCGAFSEKYDFYGEFVPRTTSGGFRVDEDFIDQMRYEPDKAYKLLTGRDNPDAGYDDCFEALSEKAREDKLRYDDESRFVFVPSPFAETIEHGGVCELQEVAAIKDPAVLETLNSALEKMDGGLRLPTGKVIKRNKNAVIVMTTNLDYRGCHELAEMVINRCERVEVAPPAEGEVKQFVRAATGIEPGKALDIMFNVYSGIMGWIADNDVPGAVLSTRNLEKCAGYYVAHLKEQNKERAKRELKALTEDLNLCRTAIDKEIVRQAVWGHELQDELRTSFLDTEIRPSAF